MECPNCNAPNPQSCCCGEPFPLKGDYDAAVETIADALVQFFGIGDDEVRNESRLATRAFLSRIGITKDA